VSALRGGFPQKVFKEFSDFDYHALRQVFGVVKLLPVPQAAEFEQLVFEVLKVHFLSFKAGRC
jgi:hypothetical protein